MEGSTAVAFFSRYSHVLCFYSVSMPEAWMEFSNKRKKFTHLEKKKNKKRTFLFPGPFLGALAHQTRFTENDFVVFTCGASFCNF